MDGLLEPKERAELSARAAALHVRAAELGDTRVQGQLALLMGTIAVVGADYATAERRLQEGYFVAELSGDRRTQLQLAGRFPGEGDGGDPADAGPAARQDGHQAPHQLGGLARARRRLHQKAHVQGISDGAASGGIGR